MLSVDLHHASYEGRCGLKAHAVLAVLRNPREMWLVARIYLFLALLPSMLRMFSIDRLVSRVTPATECRPNDSISLDRLLYLCRRAFDTLQKAGYRRTCLRRSLLLYHFLRCHGVPARINFGVKWEDGCLAGHSWLTLRDELFMEPPDKVAQFTPFFFLPDEGGRSDSELRPGGDIRSRLKHCSFD
jgi:hypothetical protein